MGATHVRLVSLQATFNGLGDVAFERRLTLLVSRDGLALRHFYAPEFWDSPRAEQDRGKLQAFEWPARWRVWEGMVVSVWRELVTPGRPLPPSLGRAEALNIVPESLLDDLWSGERDELSRERAALMRDVEYDGLESWQPKAYPSQLGFLLFSADDQPIGWLGVHLALRDDGGLLAYSAAFRAIEPSR